MAVGVGLLEGIKSLIFGRNRLSVGLPHNLRVVCCLPLSRFGTTNGSIRLCRYTITLEDRLFSYKCTMIGDLCHEKSLVPQEMVMINS